MGITSQAGMETARQQKPNDDSVICQTYSSLSANGASLSQPSPTGWVKEQEEFSGLKARHKSFHVTQKKKPPRPKPERFFGCNRATRQRRP